MTREEMSNRITDMIINGAPKEELVQELKHSMEIMDMEKEEK